MPGVIYLLVDKSCYDSAVKSPSARTVFTYHANQEYMVWNINYCCKSVPSDPISANQY